MINRRPAPSRKSFLLQVRRQLSRASIALALVAPGALVSAEPRTVTKTDIRTDPPATTHNRLRDVVWDMIEREDMRREADPQRPLSNLFFRTRKRGTEVPALCRFDSLIVELAPLNRRRRAADTRVAAVGVRAHSNFQFLVLPAGDYDSISEHTRLPSDTDCSALDGREDDFFFAEDEEIATDGLRALLALQQRLREGAAFPLHCYDAEAENRDCGQRILALGQGLIGSIERCEAKNEHLCFTIMNDNLAVAITVTGRNSPGPPYGQIVSARLNDMITLSHPLID